MKFPLDQPGVQPIIDYFGHQPTRPKEEIGRALGELGFYVPTLFDSLDDAVNSGADFVARSEGPDELYHSGLKTSVCTRSRYYDADELRAYAARLSDPERNFRSLIDKKPLGARGIIAAETWHRYVRRSFGDDSWQEDETLAASHGLSYWQYVQGDNFYMAGDNANPERYYVGRTTEGRTSFTVVDDGRITSHYARTAAGQGRPDVSKFVEFYTNVRQAPLFDPSNVPILEFSDPGTGYELQFLQYLPGQMPITELPDITAPQDEVVLVRGATPKEGLSTHIIEPSHATEAIRSGKHPIILGKANPFDGAVNEYLFPRTDVLMTHPIADVPPDAFWRSMGLVAVDHNGRTWLHKPRLTLALSKLAMDFLARRQREQTRPIPLHIFADGTRAEVYAQIGSHNVELHRLREQVRERTKHTTD